MEEKLIIQSILKGNISEFSYFVDTYQEMAYTIAFRLCNNRQDAEDVTQEAFIKAFRNLHTFRQGSRFSTWFYRIVYNTALNQIRTDSFTNEHVDYTELHLSIEDPDMDLFEQIKEEERHELIEAAIQKLPKDYAILLTLFYMEENAIKEIEQITGWSQNNIKVKLHRARKLFAEVLNPIVSNREL